MMTFCSFENAQTLFEQELESSRWRKDCLALVSTVETDFKEGEFFYILKYEN